MPGREAFAAGLSDFSCPRCGARGLWQLRERLHRRSNSLTTFATCGACGERAFLKLLPGGREDAEDHAAREFEAARAAYRNFPSHPDFGVAAPWHRAGRLLAFACVAGQSPERILCRGALPDATSLARRMGHWFALFHGACTPRVAPSSDSLPRRRQDLVERWRSSSLPVAATRALEALEAYDLPTGPQRHVWQHGDAKPDNFLFDGRSLVGLDVDGRHWNVPENDPAQRAMHTRLASWTPLAGIEASRVRQLCQALTSGYSAMAPLDEPALEAYRWLYLLSFWAGRRGHGGLRRWSWDRVFSGLAATLGPP